MGFLYPPPPSLPREYSGQALPLEGGGALVANNGLYTEPGGGYTNHQPLITITPILPPLKGPQYPHHGLRQT